jgi:hypothetical protein
MNRSLFLVISSLLLLAAVASAQIVRPANSKHHSITPTNPGAVLLFDDEFEGTSLNTTYWNQCYPESFSSWGCSNDSSIDLEWFWKYNVSVANGYLNLTALKQQEHGHNYTSGMIATGGSPLHVPGFTFLYGYMEMSAQFPPGAGMWPGFWLLPIDGTSPYEIDAMEWQGGVPDLDYATIHYNGVGDETVYYTGDNLSAGFHTYGVDWEADSVTLCLRIFQRSCSARLRTCGGRGRSPRRTWRRRCARFALALLEADVNLNVVKELIDHIREKAMGQEVMTSLSPTEQVTKIVRDELIAILGKDVARFQFASRPPTVILMAGLQGSGKTTTAGKLAAWLQKGGHRPMLVSVDVYRPAAREQLRVVAQAIKAQIYEGDEKGEASGTALVERSVKEARREAVISGCDTLIVDTAGRLHIDDELMDEMAKLKKLLESAGDFVCGGRDDRAGRGAVGGGVSQAAGADGRGADEDGWRCAGRRGAFDSACDGAAGEVYRDGREAGRV